METSEMTEAQAIELLRKASEAGHLFYDGTPENGRFYITNILSGVQEKQVWTAAVALGGKAFPSASSHRIEVANGDEFARTLREHNIEFTGETSLSFVERYLNKPNGASQGRGHTS